jgi:hypothetical protein
MSFLISHFSLGNANSETPSRRGAEKRFKVFRAVGLISWIVADAAIEDNDPPNHMKQHQWFDVFLACSASWRLGGFSYPTRTLK